MIDNIRAQYSNLIFTLVSWGFSVTIHAATPHDLVLTVDSHLEFTDKKIREYCAANNLNYSKFIVQMPYVNAITTNIGFFPLT